uniref:Uncharacterized protein n=1 Tax=Chrysemys picta bellii TaxID=8478 RepID=A0A8C3H8H1_CHRPI
MGPNTLLQVVLGTASPSLQESNGRQLFRAWMAAKSTSAASRRRCLFPPPLVE